MELPHLGSEASKFTTPYIKNCYLVFKYYICFIIFKQVLAKLLPIKMNKKIAIKREQIKKVIKLAMIFEGLINLYIVVFS